MFIPSTLGTISDSLDKILICQWWRLHASSEILTVARRNGFFHYYFINPREGARLSNSAIFEPVETEKKSWNLFTSWLLCRSAIVILSLITSNAFCHLLVTNLHLADYQRSPNQWVIGVEDCADNPGNESTEKLTAEESLPVTSVRSYTQRFSTFLTEFLLVGKSVEGVRHRFVTGNGMNYTSLCNDTSKKRLISNRLCQRVLPGKTQSRVSTNMHEFAFPQLPFRTIC